MELNVAGWRDAMVEKAPSYNDSFPVRTEHARAEKEAVTSQLVELKRECDSIERSILRVDLQQRMLPALHRRTFLRHLTPFHILLPCEFCSCFCIESNSILSLCICLRVPIFYGLHLKSIISIKLSFNLRLSPVGKETAVITTLHNLFSHVNYT